MVVALNMEPTLSWKRVWCAVVVLVAFIFLYSTFASTEHSRFATFSKPLDRVRPMEKQQHQQPLNFDLETADALTEAECSEHFPDLYYDIERAVAYWKEKQHTINADDVEISWRTPGENSGGGAVRVLIHENELRILESMGTMGHMGYRGRAMGVLNLLQRAMDSATAGGEKLPTIEASLLFQDNSDPPLDRNDTHSYWSFASYINNESHQRIWLMPNFDFWYAYPMGSYRDARRRAFQYDTSFFNKIPKVVWRGSGWVNWKLRGALIEETKDKDWADVKVVDWGGTDNKDGLTVEEMCSYAMMVHTEGIAYSGRLKYLLNCDSLPIIHKLDWNTYYSHLLQKNGPKQNYVSVERDWSDLETKVKHYLDNPQEAERLIQNSLDTFRRRYLTRAATSCYLRKLIRGYSSVSYTPEVEQPSEEGKTIMRRGFSFERFMDSPLDRVYEHELS